MYFVPIDGYQNEEYLLRRDVIDVLHDGPNPRVTVIDVKGKWPVKLRFD